MKNKPALRAIIMLFKSAPIRMVLLFLFSILCGILPSMNILVSIKLINWVSSVVQGSTEIIILEIVKILIFWGVIKFTYEILTGLSESMQSIVVDKFSALLMLNISNKLAELEDLSFFETRENLLKIEMVKSGLTTRPQNYVFNLTSNFQRIINLISMFSVLFFIDFYLPILMFFSTVPVFIISQYTGKKLWKMLEKLEDDKTQMTTYIKHSLDGEKAKDNFLFEFVKNFQTKYIETQNKYLKDVAKISYKGLFLTLFSRFVSAIITIGLFVLMVFIVVKKRIAVGAVAGYVQAFMHTQYELQDLATYGRWFFIINGYFKNYFDLIDWNNQPKDCKDKIKLDEKINSIEFKNVSFFYPTKNNNENYVIKDLNFLINSEKTYAIVGKNGSGKTTLIKLLVGFYQPQHGQIIINGKYNLNDLDMHSYRNKLSALFQDFAIYSGYNIDENIFINTNHSVEQENEKQKQIKFFGNDFQNRLAKFGTKILGLQYGGQDLSGGEKQRLAAIRAFLKPSDIIFFDEPTSAIDPIAEKDFVDLIFRMSKGKLAVVVTHRMASVKNCNEIIVIDHGCLIEKGSFYDLMNKHALFYELYKTQQEQFETLELFEKKNID